MRPNKGTLPIETMSAKKGAKRSKFEYFVWNLRYIIVLLVWRRVLRTCLGRMTCNTFELMLNVVLRITFSPPAMQTRNLVRRSWCLWPTLELLSAWEKVTWRTCWRLSIIPKSSLEGSGPSETGSGRDQGAKGEQGANVFSCWPLNILWRKRQ